MRRLRVACLVSGGKDSIGAAYVVHQWGWTIDSFVTLLPQAEAPMLYHRPNAKWVRLQAEAVGVPWLHADVKPAEDELAPLRALLSTRKVDGLVVGALASEFQRTRFEGLCRDLGIRSFAPFWHHDPSRHVRQLHAMGLRSVLVHVAAAGLDRGWLGRELDAAGCDALDAVAQKHRINVAGEGGEYETFVVDAPFFRQPITIMDTKVQWRRDEGTLEIERAEHAGRGMR